MIWILLLIIIPIMIYLYYNFFKLPKIKSILFIDGSLGTGKSYLSVALAIKYYKRNLKRYKIKKIIYKMIRKKEEPEKPILYSNIKLKNIEFAIITKDLLFRKNYRFAKGSIILLDEFSLVADQMMYKNAEINERLSLFFKLFRHETGKGSLCIINSQSTSDLHYSLKYVLSDYIYIHHKTRLPFFNILKVQEMTYNADKNATTNITTNEGDIEDNLKNMLISSKYFKYYDSYCYSIFTDNLPIYKNTKILRNKDSLKAENLVSFKDFKYLYENLKKEENQSDGKENTHMD